MKIGAKWEKIEGNINSKCIKTKKEANNSLPLFSCGGRTRTCDLQVMSLASYQLLHTAI